MNKIDLNWDDNEVLPNKIGPDVEFLLNRMNQATLEMVDVQPGEVILDVGCGRAIDAVNMSKSGALVIGLDPSHVMLSHAKEVIKRDGHNTMLFRAIGEYMPFLAGSIDKVVCKGALDHFADPEKAIQQMAAAVKPDGKVVIAVANFESLGFKIGKFIFGVRKLLRIKNPYKRLPWEPPPDHTVKFNYNMISKSFDAHLRVEKTVGVSLLCSMPGWGDVLGWLPKEMSAFILARLDRIAISQPGNSDVVILIGRPG